MKPLKYRFAQLSHIQGHFAYTDFMIASSEVKMALHKFILKFDSAFLMVILGQYPKNRERFQNPQNSTLSANF